MLFDLTIIGLAITLEPLPLTGFILVVGGERGTRKGMAFLLGLVRLFGPRDRRSCAVHRGHAAQAEYGTVHDCARDQAASRRRVDPARAPAARPHGTSAEAGQLAGKGGRDVDAECRCARAALQPWALVAAGAATVTTAEVSNAREWLALLFFCLLSSASLILMESFAKFRPTRPGSGSTP